MDRNVGASFTLSVLTVIAFAVVLYEPEARVRAPTPGAGRSAPQGGPAVSSKGVGPVDAPAVEVVEARDPDTLEPPRAPRAAGADRRDPEKVDQVAPSIEPPRPAVPVRAVSASASGSTTGSGLDRGADRPQSTVALPSARGGMAGRPGPRGAFTTVRVGEDLAAVARRVYGSEEEVSRLWQANRDQLDREDSPLAAGTLLRTPRGAW